MRLSMPFAALAAALFVVMLAAPVSAEPSDHATPQTQATESQSEPAAEAEAPSAGKADTDSAGPGQSDTDSATVEDSDTDSASPGESDTDSATVKDSDTDSAGPGESDTDSATVKDSDTDSAKPGQSDTDSAAVEDSDTKSAAPAEQPKHGSTAVEGESDPDTSETLESDADPADQKPESKVLVTIDKGIQEMTVWVDGVEQYSWPVSTGIAGYSTPSGTYTTTSMNKIWYSKQWDNAPMPHAIFFTKKGHAIHGTLEKKKLGSAASHGCVRLDPKNAETLFKLVEEKGLKNTEGVLTGVTPGGEYKVAQPPRQRTYPAYPGRGWYGRYGFYEEPPVQRRAKRRRWFQPYYQAPPPQQYQRRGQRWFRPPGY